MRLRQRLLRCRRSLRGGVMVLVIALAFMAGGPSAPIALAAGEALSGSGSTWSANAVNQWVADVRGQGTNVNFTPNGSGQGRAQFAVNQADFADSDIPYQGEDPLTHQQDTSARPFAYIPIIAGGTSLMYHLQAGNNLIRNVRLSGETVAKIFTAKITMWNDAQITADNNGRVLPAKRIQVVVDSQGGGTTAQFTDWMVHQYGPIWASYAGANVPTSYYPRKADNISGAPGDDRISATITSPDYDGAIGFVQYSYALNARFPVAKVLNASGYFTAPTPYNVAVALTRADIELNNHDPRFYLTQQLGRVYTSDDPRTYALSSYSYMIIPTKPDDPYISPGKAVTFENFSYYALCDGQQKAPRLGYSPLPRVLVQRAFDQVPHFPKYDPAIGANKNPNNCKNPTFDDRDPNRNLLAEIDPAPAPCDKIGQGPCDGDNNADPFGPGGANGAGGANGSGNGNGSGGDGTGGPNGGKNGPNGGKDGTGNGSGAANASNVDANGDASSDPNGDSGSSSVAGTSSELAAFRSQNITRVMGVLAAVELVLVLLVPAFVARANERRKAAGEGGGQDAR